MSNRLINPCSNESVSKIVYEHLLWVQQRCVECGSTSFLEVHHRVYRSQWTKETMRFFLQEKSKEFWKELYWDLHSEQNLVVLCRRHHQLLHQGANYLSEKYIQSFTDIATWRNIFYNVENYKKYQFLKI